MNPIRILFGCGMLLGALAPVWAENAAEVVGVEAPYVRAVPPGQRNSAAFMRLHNGGDQAHALTGARSPIAEAVELHTHMMRDGMMSMRPVERVDLPAREVVSLQPGGLHVMLIGLQQQLELGKEVPLTLVFEDGSERRLGAPVQKINVEAMQHQHHQH
jgi:copper(I)-binding protein